MSARFMAGPHSYLPLASWQKPAPGSVRLDHGGSRRPRLLKAVAIVSLALAAAPASAQPAPASPPGQNFTPAQRAEIVAILRDALKTDPSILRDAIAGLQADEGERKEAAGRASIAAATGALTRTPGDAEAGNPAGDVTVVEFYDLRCPYCRHMLPVVADLLRHDANIRWVFKDIPILGPASVVGARAVLAAGRQGRYAAMRDALMSGNPDITPDAVHAASDRLGLDWARLSRDMDDPAVRARLDANVELARRLEVDGTPAYVVGGRMLTGATDEADAATGRHGGTPNAARGTIGASAPSRMDAEAFLAWAASRPKGKRHELHDDVPSLHRRPEAYASTPGITPWSC